MMIAISPGIKTTINATNSFQIKSLEKSNPEVFCNLSFSIISRLFRGKNTK